MVHFQLGTYIVLRCFEVEALVLRVAPSSSAVSRVLTSAARLAARCTADGPRNTKPPKRTGTGACSCTSSGMVWRTPGQKKLFTGIKRERSASIFLRKISISLPIRFPKQSARIGTRHTIATSYYSLWCICIFQLLEKCHQNALSKNLAARTKLFIIITAYSAWTGPLLPWTSLQDKNSSRLSWLPSGFATVFFSWCSATKPHQYYIQAFNYYYYNMHSPPLSTSVLFFFRCRDALRAPKYGKEKVRMLFCIFVPRKMAANALFAFIALHFSTKSTFSLPCPKAASKPLSEHCRPPYQELQLRALVWRGS